MSIKTNIVARSNFDINDPSINTLIEMSITRLAENAFNNSESYDYAVALLVMHWLTLKEQAKISNNIGGAGGIKSITEGRLSISFGSISGSSVNILGDLQQTSYGVELASFLETSIILPATRFG